MPLGFLNRTVLAVSCIASSCHAADLFVEENSLVAQNAQFLKQLREIADQPDSQPPKIINHTIVESHTYQDKENDTQSDQ